MSVPHRPSVYDRLRPHLDAADLVRRLGLDLRRSIGSELYCRPLCHESTSGESLQINAHTGRWNCKACQGAGYYGDLIHLAEYALTNGGKPSHGGQTETHRQAVEWLCGQFGIPFDAERATGDPGLDVVHAFAMLAHQHLLERPDVLEWIQDKWGFDRQTVEGYGLGFMPDPILASITREASQPESRGAFRASGLGWYDPAGRWRTHFAGRVTFPYLEHGRAVYLIGRATPWTPLLDNGAKPPKYHKLRVHSDERPYVSPRVTNDHLYNEPVMRSAQDAVVVAEGVADAVALSALGVPVVSPVTISFNAVDLERFTRKAREQGIARVEILFDNELSGSGNYAARRAGLKLVEQGIAARILTLPLGDPQKAAREEVVQALGQELFDELERSEPRRRKELIEENVPDPSKRAWILEHVQLSKIDAAEWSAAAGAGAPGIFNEIRRKGRDVLELEVEELANGLEGLDDPSARAAHFHPVVELAAHVEDRLMREHYAGVIASAAGRGVTKIEIAKRIAAYRRDVVRPKRKDDARAAKAKAAGADAKTSLVLLPPEIQHVQPPAPPAPSAEKDTRPAAPPPPGAKVQTEHERYAPAREAVARCVEAKVPQEELGEYVAQTITRSMGYTPFRTARELYLVRGSERIPVGISERSPTFATLLMRASGLTARKTSHAGYIAQVVYFLEHQGRKAEEVSWSFVDSDRSVWFPLGDPAGNLVRLAPGELQQVRMSEARVPAVAGQDFAPLAFVEEDGGIQRAIDAFRWTSLDESGRLILVHWLACLPILRRVGTLPIVRIEGGSSSGKTRTVDAVAWLVNGRKSSSVPTAAALVSRMATEMLTIDDNRETGDVSPAFLGTMLQATHLGAREKRTGKADTGTVIERVCGALLMNGVEPIHDGKPEVASRMLVLRCDRSHRVPDSPRDESQLRAAMLDARNGFWSEALRRCAWAMKADEIHGNGLAEQIEEVFASTRIGRLSSYLRLMVLVWIAGQPEGDRPRHLESLPPVWARAFAAVGSRSLESLLKEELAVTALRYVFAYGRQVAEKPSGLSHLPAREAFGGSFTVDDEKGDASLGPIRVSKLARLARTAAKDLNGPDSLARFLRAGQLEERLVDGQEFVEASGFRLDFSTTNAGRVRVTVYQFPEGTAPASSAGGGDTWTGPA